MNFNFNTSRVKCSKLGFKVHVVKALIGMKEKEAREPAELDVLSKAVDYIKSLEAHVARLEANQVVNITNNISVSGDAHAVAESASRGLLGRLFLGERQ